MEELEQRIAELMNSISDLNDRLSHSNHNNDDLNDEVSKKNSEIIRLQGLINQLEDKCSGLNRSID